MSGSDSDGGFTPALINKVLDSPKFHLRRKTYAAGAIGVIGAAVVIAFCATSWAIVDNPYDLLNDFVRIGTSVLVCVALLVTLTIKSLMAEGTRELFLTGCTSSCESKYGLFLWGPFSAAIFILLLAIPQFLLCHNIYRNPLVNPSQAQLKSAAAKIQPPKKSAKAKGKERAPSSDAEQPGPYDAPVVDSSEDGKPQMELGSQGRHKSRTGSGREKKKSRTKDGGEGGRYQEV